MTAMEVMFILEVICRAGYHYVYIYSIYIRRKSVTFDKIVVVKF